MPEKIDLKPLADDNLPDSTRPDILLVTDIRSIKGFFDVVSVIPAHTPRNLWDSIKVYVNGATRRMYIYDFKAHVWMYSTLT